jgi:hypothetical protein
MILVFPGHSLAPSILPLNDFDDRAVAESSVPGASRGIQMRRFRWIRNNY